MDDVLTARALNRASLGRQLLLERVDADPVEVVDRLVGLQAQNPLDPYTGLWSRLAGFDPDVVGAAVLDRRLVRIVVQRGTIHLVTASDCRRIRPLVQPVLDAELVRHSQYKDALAGLDLAPVLAFGRAFLVEPRSVRALRAALSEAFPELDPGALSLACRNRLGLVQVPPRGVWGAAGEVTLCTAESWLGAPFDETYRIDDLVLRYLAAFGPATVADVAAWTRLTGFRPVLERLRPQLRTFRDERGRELFDVPGGLRPDPDTPAPPRFLPEYDNALLSYADRARFGGYAMTWPDHPPRGALLVDGVGSGTWTVTDGVLVVSHRKLVKRDVAAVRSEAQALGAFLPVGVTDVRLLEA